jgi:ElaB/YqjD/DUF883 family membrane-anchored ribosome-binding protein
MLSRPVLIKGRVLVPDHRVVARRFAQDNRREDKTMNTPTLDNTRRMASDAMERAGERVREMRTGVNDMASRGMSTMSESAAAAQRQLGQYAQATTRYVGEHPMKTALIAAGVGALVAGLVLALRRNRDDSF